MDVVNGSNFEAFSSSSNSVLAVRKITGISRVSAAALRRRQISYPSIPGIAMSNRIKSGLPSAPVIASAFSPLVATLVLKRSFSTQKYPDISWSVVDNQDCFSRALHSLTPRRL